MYKKILMLAMLGVASAVFAQDLTLDQDGATSNDGGGVVGERGAPESEPVKGRGHLNHVGYGFATGKTGSGPISLGDDDDSSDDQVTPNPNDDDGDELSDEDDDSDSGSDSDGDGDSDSDSDGDDPSPSR